MQKTGRRISLFRTAGRNKQMKNTYWSPRPEARHHFHLYAEKNPMSSQEATTCSEPPAQSHCPDHATQKETERRIL